MTDGNDDLFAALGDETAQESDKSTADETSDDTEANEETEQREPITTRVTLAIVAVWSWLKPRAKSAVDRVRNELGQTRDEVAPQLRGLSLPSIPERAVVPLALAGVLIIAAVAMPAAPFASTGPVDNGTEPVTGVTYEPVDDSEYRDVVASFVSSSEDGPAAPDRVRTSAGSQTMSVETTTRDGEPAIVLEDDRTHDGRWVAMETSWFEDHVGEIPDAAYINHENGGEYAAPIETRGGEAAFYVREFSTNTVTFSGEVAINANPAENGAQFEYEIGSDENVSNASLQLTGVVNSEWDNVSASGVGPSSSQSISVGGNTQPTDGAGGNPELTVTVPKNKYNPALGEFETNSGSSWPLAGDSASDSIYQQEARIQPNQNMTAETLTVNIGGVSGSDYDFLVDIYIDTGQPNKNADSGTLVKENWDPSFETGKQTITLDTTYDLTAGQDYTIGFVTDSTDSDSNKDTINIKTKSSDGGVWFTDREIYEKEFAADLTATEDTSVSNLAVSDGDGHSHTFGDLVGGESATAGLSLSPSSSALNWSGSGGNIDYRLTMQERTVTEDPSIELNSDPGSQTLNYSGALSSGSTVDLSNSIDESLIGGNTTVSVSVSENVSSDAPGGQVGLDYSHDADTKRTIDYAGEQFSERYAVNKTFADDRANATLTVPWASDRVIEVRDARVKKWDADGNLLSDVTAPGYSSDPGEIVVDIGDIETGEKVRVFANGSKVQPVNGSITVTDPSGVDNPLNSTIRVDSTSGELGLDVGSTQYGSEIHYVTDASYETDASMRVSGSTSRLRLPNAAGSDKATIRTVPVGVSTSGSVIVEPNGTDTTEPAWQVRPGDRGNEPVQYTFTQAADGEDYVLWSQTDEVVRDSGTGSSPLTLSDDDSEETLQFLVDDGTSGGGSGGDGSTGGALGPMDAATGGALSGLLPDALPAPLVLLLAGGGLVVGLAVASRETQLFDEGTRSDAVADATRSVGVRAGGLVERLLGNEIVVSALMLGGGAWLLQSGLLDETARLIFALGAVPIAMYLALRQFGTFDVRVWAGSTAVVGVLGMVVLAPEVFQTVAEEGGIIIVAGAILLGWRALSAWRAEANTPDEVTNLEVTAEETDD